MSRQRQSSPGETDLKVGVLYNQPFEMSRGEDTDYLAEADIEDQVKNIQDALGKLDIQYSLFPIKEDAFNLIEELRSYRPDIVINICEGALGNSHLEMHVPAVLELLGITYTGSPPLTLGLCQNKGLTKDILRSKDIPTPRYRVLERFEDWDRGITYPVFVKPLREDASIGISKDSFVKDDSELKNRVEYICKRYTQPVLVEEYLEGREFTVSILGNEELEFLPISEVVFEFPGEPKIRDYSAKWSKESNEYKKTRLVCPAELEPSIKDELEEISSKAYRAMSCRDYGRIDLRMKGDTPCVLEVNPNPDVSPEGSLPYALDAAGIPFEAFVEKIIGFAIQRNQ